MIYRAQCLYCPWHTSSGSNRDQKYVDGVADSHTKLYGHDVNRWFEEVEND